MGRRSAATEPAPTETDSPPRWRDELRAFAELFALAGLAITQPLFDIFGRAPDHFVFRGAERGDVIGFAVIITFLPAAIAHLIEVLAGLHSPRTRRIAHIALLGLFASIFLVLAYDAALIRPAAIAAAAATTIPLVLLYLRTRGARIWLAFLSPAPVVFLMLFLTASPVASILSESVKPHPVAVGRPAPTIVLVLDEFPLVTLLDAEGAIDADLFPNFARLADTSHWFRDATTTSNTTVRAVPTMLTGNIPRGEGSPTAGTYPDNLFTLVGNSMSVHASETTTRLCPSLVCDRSGPSDGRGGLGPLLADARAVLGSRLSPAESTTDPLSTQFEEISIQDDHRAVQAIGQSEGVQRFDEFVDDLESSTDGLHFLHLLLPHRPHRFLPDGTTYEPPDPTPGRFLDRWNPEPEPVLAAHQQYLLQLQWTDELLGRLIDRLQAVGLWNDTILAVIADHGFGFEPGGPVRSMDTGNDRNETAMAEILWVPFFLKTPGQTDGQISDAPVRIIDLLPTLAELLDVEIPWTTEGRSALSGGSGEPDEVGFYRSIAGEGHADSPYRSLDREHGRELLQHRTTGRLAPPTDRLSGSDRIFAMGPHPELFGLDLPADARPLTVDIDTDSRVDDFDPARDRPPIFFQASADSDEIGTDVAISVDGTVWSTTTVYPAGGGRIAAVLPPQAFTDENVDLSVHALD